MSEKFVLLAGATGDLGGRIADALRARGASVRAVVRAESALPARARLESKGVEVVVADLTDIDSLAAAARGASVVVSALSGLREVILDGQTVLLDAAVKAGVPRFISSDYSSDYTRTAPGHNRNFDLRREFAGRADRAPIAVTSVFVGAFMDMLGNEMPIVQPRIRSVLYWQSRHQKLDFTTRDDTAAVTAAAALDDSAPRFIRVVGDSVTSAQLAAIMTRASGRRYRTVFAGTVGALARIVPLVKVLAPDKPDPVSPAWQGMQYSLDMFSGEAKVDPVDNGRYPDIAFTTIEQRFAAGHLPGAA